MLQNAKRIAVNQGKSLRCLQESENPVLSALRIHTADNPLYLSFYKAYAACFPENERRSETSQRAALGDPRYHLDAWLDKNTFIGFMGWWSFAPFRYIEHVAVTSEARSEGYGGSILKQWLALSEKPVLLEIEEVVDTRTRRRLIFYERLGFKAVPGVHIQPPYQGDGPGPVMQALSWPAPISEGQRRDFVSLLRSEVWAHLCP